MHLLSLLKDLNIFYTEEAELADIYISGIADDSRQVGQGYLFVACKGHEKDGHEFIEEAIERGAVAIVAESFVNLGVPCIVVKDTKMLLGSLVSQFYGNPSKEKIIIGITGTNGKTTTCYMIKFVLEAHGYRCGLIGTIEYVINGESHPSKNTTPGAVQLQKLLHESRDDVIVIEVSSHALKQGRVNGVDFDLCLFTNLDGEHLDYHDNMDDYFETKYMLFEKMKEAGQVIVNVDDEWGRKLYERLLRKGIPALSIGKGRLNDLKLVSDGDYFNLKNGVTLKIDLALPGLHNKYNAAFTVLVAFLMNLEWEKTLHALKNLKRIPGRFELFQLHGDVTVVVDYAHTAKGFYYCLNAIRECGAKRIFHVFGFRGNRDKKKREAMINNSVSISDYYILTFDDLNNVSDEEMEEELIYFYETFGKGKGEIITDRTLAIQKAISLASAGDWVVITGKGPEMYTKEFNLKTKTDVETVEKLSSSRAKLL